jgi:hypothetical protein
LECANQINIYHWLLNTYNQTIQSKVRIFKGNFSRKNKGVVELAKVKFLLLLYICLLSRIYNTSFRLGAPADASGNREHLGDDASGCKID